MVLFERKMFKLSKKTEYGLLALQYLADRPENVATVREIAEFHNVSKTLLAKVLQMLAKKNIVESVQGAQGGYVIADNIDNITIARILEAIDGPIHITDCYDKESGCERTSDCTLKHRFVPIQKGIMQQLSSMSLAQFFKE